MEIMMTARRDCLAKANTELVLRFARPSHAPVMALGLNE